MNLLETIKKKEKEYLIHRNLEKDEILYREDDYCEVIGIVINGELIITSFLENGNTIIYNDIKDNGVFGNNLIFSSYPYFRGDIIATKDTEVVLISKDNLIKLLTTNNDFLIEYMRIQSNFGKELNARIKLLSINNIQDRFLYYLHLNKDVISYNTITDLAKQLNIERETLSRLISKLIKNNIIIRDNKTIKVIKR